MVNRFRRALLAIALFVALGVGFYPTSSLAAEAGCGAMRPGSACAGCGPRMSCCRPEKPAAPAVPTDAPRIERGQALMPNLIVVVPECAARRPLATVGASAPRRASRLALFTLHAQFLI